MTRAKQAATLTIQIWSDAQEVRAVRFQPHCSRQEEGVLQRTQSCVTQTARRKRPRTARKPARGQRGIRCESRDSRLRSTHPYRQETDVKPGCCIRYWLRLPASAAPVSQSKRIPPHKLLSYNSLEMWRDRRPEASPISYPEAVHSREPTIVLSPAKAFSDNHWNRNWSYRQRSLVTVPPAS